jgi:Family of unknown function (DUF6454)
VDVRTLEVTREFTVDDHIGGVVYDASTGHLVGNNWGSRTFYEWTPSGRLVTTWKNPDDLVDFQDCQYVPLKLTADGDDITMWAAPDNGDEGAGTEIYTWQAALPHRS